MPYLQALSPNTCPVCYSYFKDANVLRRHASHCSSTPLQERLAPALDRAPPGQQAAKDPVAAVCFSTKVGQTDAAACYIASEPAQEKELVPSSGQHAVVGAVCWFCCSPVDASHGSTKVCYGGLPILFCHPCAALHAKTVQDEDVIAAYLRLPGNSSRSSARMTSMVQLAAMRQSEHIWLSQNSIVSPSKPRTTANEDQSPIECCTVPQTEVADLDEDCIPLSKLATDNDTPSKDRPAISIMQTQPESTYNRHAREPDVNAIEDNVPFAQLIDDKHECGQASDHITAAVALRSSAIWPHNCAQEVVDLDNEEQLATTSADASAVASDMLPEPEQSHSFKHLPDEGSTGEEEYTEVPTARSVFLDRPGYKRQYTGFIGSHELPPVLPDEKRVLSHHLSPQATFMYNKAQQEKRCGILVLGFPGSSDDAKKFRNLVKISTEAYLMRHMPYTGKKALAWMSVSYLPEDPPPDPSLEVKGVKEGDYRKGLIPKQDLAVETRAALAKGTVLGLYRNLTITSEEEAQAKEEEPEDCQMNGWEWAKTLDAYTADIVPPERPNAKQADIYAGALEGQSLHCMAYTVGNIMAVINDGAADPMTNPKSAKNCPENVSLVPISIGQWPFLFVVTVRDIAAGEELLLDYSHGFWALQKQHMQDIRRHERELQKEGRLRFGSGSFSHAGNQGSGAAISNLQLAQVRPSTQTNLYHVENIHNGPDIARRHMQTNSLPVGAATSALSAATPAASATTAQPCTLHPAATAPPAVLLNTGSTTDIDLEEAGAESQPSPLKQEGMADALLPPHSWEAAEAAKTPHEAPTGALADTGHGSPTKQGIKRERMNSEASRLAAEEKPVLRSLPLHPGIEDAIRASPGLVTGYAESKLAHEQMLQRFLPDLMQLMPLCNQIIADSRHQQEQRQRHSADTPSPEVQAQFAMLSNKQARLNDSGPHRLSNSAVASSAVHEAAAMSDPQAHNSWIRMESRTGSSGVPVACQPPTLSLHATSAKHKMSEAPVPSAIGQHPKQKQSNGDVDGASPMEAWQADIAQAVAPMQAGLTAINTSGGSAVCRDGQKPRLSGDPSSKGNAASGEWGNAGQTISPTAVSPPAVQSPKTSRLKPGDDSLLRPVGKLHDPDRYALSRGIGRSTERKLLGNGFPQSGPKESLLWKQQLEGKAVRKSS